MSYEIDPNTGLVYAESERRTWFITIFSSIMISIGGALIFQIIDDKLSGPPVIDLRGRSLPQPGEDNRVAQDIVKVKSIRQDVIEEFIGSVINSIYPQLYDQPGLTEQQVRELVAQAIEKYSASKENDHNKRSKFEAPCKIKV